MAEPQQQTFSNVQPIQAAQTFTDVTPIGATGEEAAFLKSNPSYQWLSKDPKFPNRQEGIYSMGPGNEWRNDPNHPMHDVTQMPVDLHLGRHTYEAARDAAAGSTLPLTFEASLPQLAGGLLGGAAGSVAGKEIAKSAGAGEVGQEVAGDVGGVAGGLLTGAAANVAVSKARAIYTALPDVLQKELLGVASPRLKNAIRLWDALTELKERPTPKPLDATGENVDYAGAKPPKPAPVLDATGENKPFAGGMDEWNPKPQRTIASLNPKPAPVQTAPVIPAPKPAPAPGSAGSLVQSVAEQPVAGKSDPLLARLKKIAADIETHEKAAATSTPNLDEDLTPLLLEHLRQVRAQKGVVTQ